MNENFELENMRQQMQTLKNKLNQQEIVNDQLMRKAIGSKLRRIKLDRWRKLVIILMGVVYVPWMLRNLGIPLWFILLSVAFFAVAGIYDVWFTTGLGEDDTSDKHLMEMQQKIIRMKEMNSRWLWVGIPFAFAWSATLIILIFQGRLLDTSDLTPIIISIAIGATIGMAIGITIYRKQQRYANELIDQIEELKNS